MDGYEKYNLISRCDGDEYVDTIWLLFKSSMEIAIK